MQQHRLATGIRCIVFPGAPERTWRMFLELAYVLFGFLAIFLGWFLCGVIIGSLALVIKASFKGRGWWQYAKEVIVISPDAWYGMFVQLGPTSIVMVPLALLFRFDPQNERDNIDQREFCRTTGLRMEQWVTHGHREANTTYAQESLANFDRRCTEFKQDIQEMPARVTYWTRVYAGLARRYAWVTATCAMILTFVKTGTVMAATADTTADTTVSVVNNQPEKAVVGLSGYGTMTMSGNTDGQSIKLTHLRFCPTWERGRLRLKVEIGASASLTLKKASIGYDYPELGYIEAGRLAVPYAYNVLPSNKNEFNRTPFDEMDVPFFDNGIMVTRPFDIFGQEIGVKAAVTSGSGGYDDDNSSLDGSIRVNADTRFGSISATAQYGQQPDGVRELYAAQYNLNLGPVTFQLFGMERPDADSDGFMGSVIARAGPASISAQYERINTPAGSDRFCDAGINWQLGSMSKLKSRVLISDQAKPVYTVRLVQLF